MRIWSLGILLTALCAPAFAMNEPGRLGIEAGASFLPQASGPLLGAEYTFVLSDAWELGGFYDYNSLTSGDGTPGALHFFGGIARIHLGFVPGVFFDAKVGATQEVINTISFPMSAGGGVGLGYRLELGDWAELSPRAGVRLVPTHRIIDTSLLFSVRF